MSVKSNNKVIDYKLLEHYTTWVKFDDASEQTINLEPVLYGAMWGALRDLEFFKQVTIDPIACTLCWPNGADFDPETLRNWSKYKDELAARAQSWERVLA
jgi:Protein of unknown function (DUF2442)